MCPFTIVWCLWIFHVLTQTQLSFNELSLQHLIEFANDAIEWGLFFFFDFPCRFYFIASQRVQARSNRASRLFRLFTVTTATTRGATSVICTLLEANYVLPLQLAIYSTEHKPHVKTSTYRIRESLSEWRRVFFLWIYVHHLWRNFVCCSIV